MANTSPTPSTQNAVPRCKDLTLSNGWFVSRRPQGQLIRCSLSRVRDSPLRPELPGGRLRDLGDATAIRAHREQIAETRTRTRPSPGGRAAMEDDLRPVRRPARVEAGATVWRIEGQLREPAPVPVDRSDVASERSDSDHDPLPVG